MKTNHSIITGVLCGALVVAVDALPPQPVSLANGNATTGAGHSFVPVMSANGARAAFVSHANNLTTNDDAGQWLDVFVRDIHSGATLLASVSTNGTGGGNENSAMVSLSANGRIVAFASLAGNLVNGDANGAHDVFVRDLDSGITRMASVTPGGDSPVDSQNLSSIPLSGNPMLTAGGEMVFFESRATNLIATGLAATGVNIYVRHLLSNSTALVSADEGGTPFTNYCELASISTNGGVAAFVARAGASRFDSPGDVFVRDLSASTTVRASSAAEAYTATYRCGGVQLTSDGQFMTYIAAGLPEGTVLFRYGVASGISIAIATNVLEHSDPQISATGRYVTFTDGTNILRWDSVSGGTAIVNATIAGAPPTVGRARNPAADSTGNTIMFVSDSSQLTTNGPGELHVYARDMASGTTRLLTAGNPGTVSTGVDFFTGISMTPSGSHAAFDATTANLFSADNNSASDAFVIQLVDGPNVQLARLPGGAIELKWVTVPSAAYTIQYKETFAGSEWRNLTADVQKSGSTATTVDTASGGARFYRVIESR